MPVLAAELRRPRVCRAAASSSSAAGTTVWVLRRNNDDKEPPAIAQPQNVISAWMGNQVCMQVQMEMQEI